jgi:hypothetical protein
LAGGAAFGAGAVGARLALTPVKTLTTKVAPMLKSLGEKIETVVVKPIKRDMESGFKTENIFKYDLGGNLQQSYDKATAKLATLRQQARQLREGREKVIDLEDIMNKTVKDIENQKFRLTGVRSRIDTSVENFIAEFERNAPGGKVTVPQAQEMKEAVGTFGSWLFGARDLDSSANERVANIIYSHLKKAIEKNSGKGLKAINQEMAEIIPIKNALIRRIPVAERGSVLTITDILSAGFSLQSPQGWGLLVLNRLLKSGRVAEKVFRAGERLEKLKNPIIERLPKGLRNAPRDTREMFETLGGAGFDEPTPEEIDFIKSIK